MAALILGAALSDAATISTFFYLLKFYCVDSCPLVRMAHRDNSKTQNPPCRHRMVSSKIYGFRGSAEMKKDLDCHTPNLPSSASRTHISSAFQERKFRCTMIRVCRMCVCISSSLLAWRRFKNLGAVEVFTAAAETRDWRKMSFAISHFAIPWASGRCAEIHVLR